MDLSLEGPHCDRSGFLYIFSSFGKTTDLKLSISFNLTCFVLMSKKSTWSVERLRKGRMCAFSLIGKVNVENVENRSTLCGPCYPRIWGRILHSPPYLRQFAAFWSWQRAWKYASPRDLCLVTETHPWFYFCAVYISAQNKSCTLFFAHRKGEHHVWRLKTGVYFLHFYFPVILLRTLIQLFPFNVKKSLSLIRFLKKWNGKNALPRTE